MVMMTRLALKLAEARIPLIDLIIESAQIRLISAGRCVESVRLVKLLAQGVNRVTFAHLGRDPQGNLVDLTLEGA